MVIKLLTGILVFETIDWQIVCGMKQHNYFIIFYIEKHTEAIINNRFVCRNATYPEKSCLLKFFYCPDLKRFFFNQIGMKTNKHLILQFLF